MIRILLLWCFLFSYGTAISQRFVTRNGNARFYSKTELEDIAADNTQVMAIIDPGSKSIAVSMLMKGFLFKKALMQDHFNENYVESDKYPKAQFEGNYTDQLDVSTNGLTKIFIRGKLTMHGATKNVEMPATVMIKDGVLSCKAEFQLVPEDFQIKIPNLVRDKIARKVDVFIAFDLRKQ
jgi:YceI-like domain